MPKCPLKFTVIRENNVIDLEAIFLMIISLVVLDNNIRDLKQNKALTSRTIAVHVRYKSNLHFLDVLCKTTTGKNHVLRVWRT